MIESPRLKVSVALVESHKHLKLGVRWDARRQCFSYAVCDREDVLAQDGFVSLGDRTTRCIAKVTKRPVRLTRRTKRCACRT